MIILLPCIGGPFDGQSMPRPERGTEAAFWEHTLALHEMFSELGAAAEERSGDDDPSPVDTLHEVAGEFGDEGRVPNVSSRFALYCLEHESLVFIRSITHDEYKEWERANAAPSGD